MAENFSSDFVPHPSPGLNSGASDSHRSLLDTAANDVFKPLANSALVDPWNTVAHTVNWAAHGLSGHDLLPEVSALKMQAAQPFTAEWAVQSMSSGLGALLPYTLAGKAMGGAMRGVGASME